MLRERNNITFKHCLRQCLWNISPISRKRLNKCKLFHRKPVSNAAHVIGKKNLTPIFSRLHPLTCSLAQSPIGVSDRNQFRRVCSIGHEDELLRHVKTEDRLAQLTLEDRRMTSWGCWSEWVLISHSFSRLSLSQTQMPPVHSSFGWDLLLYCLCVACAFRMWRMGSNTEGCKNGEKEMREV